MLAFTQWLDATALSDAVGNLLWLIPTLQTIHIIALALLFTSVGAVALASFGRLGRSVAIADLARRFAPWVWGALAVLLLTGSILIVGEPTRELINWAFWIKIPLILAAACWTGILFSRLGRSVPSRDDLIRARARRLVPVLMLLWTLVVIFGRLIAYAQIDA